jgi:hypothetical protein
MAWPAFWDTKPVAALMRAAYREIPGAGDEGDEHERDLATFRLL